MTQYDAVVCGMTQPATADSCLTPQHGAMTETAGLPLYRWQEIADDITEKIRTGRLPVGARLPGERLLCEEYGAALGTVRRAVRELKEQGVIGVVPAKGTYVLRKPSNEESAPE